MFSPTAERRAEKWTSQSILWFTTISYNHSQYHHVNFSMGFISHLETLEVEDICEDEGPLGELLVAGLDDVGEDHAVRAVHRAQLAGEAGAQLAEAARDQNPAGEVVLLPTNNTAEDTAMTR